MPHRLLASLALAALLAGCATVSPVVPSRGPAGYAAAPRPGGLLEAVEARVRQAHGPERSAFHLLDANEEGLRLRLALVDSARHTLDLQYYVWWADESGALLMKRVIEAADRGVKVRLVLDDLTTLLADESHPKVRDPALLRVDAHPNIEIRLFNAWRERTLGGRAWEAIERMERINHRMHNKLLVADNRAAVIGGRNIGNEYFGLSPEFNFRDLDVLGIGPVARQASGVFDNFWNSDWVVPVASLGPRPGPRELREEYAPIRRELAAAPALSRIRVDREDWTAEFERLSGAFHAGTSRVHTDTPDPGAIAHHMPDAIRALMGSARGDILVTNAYIIPDERSVALLRSLKGRGVRLRVLTNSLASHDVPAVNSHYKAWRRPLLEAGVELHEARHDAAVRGRLADTAPTVSGFMGLHVKAMVIDRERVFIGSMNLDPRSASINSEMGVVIDSPGLAGALAAAFEQDMGPENAWRVDLGPDGALRWRSAGGERSWQPARSLWQRIEDLVFMAFPRDLY